MLDFSCALQSEIYNLKSEISQAPLLNACWSGVLEPTIRNRESSSDYGVHASALRKPEVIAGRPPANGGFRIRPHGGAGELIKNQRSKIKEKALRFLNL